MQHTQNNRNDYVSGHLHIYFEIKLGGFKPLDWSERDKIYRIFRIEIQYIMESNMTETISSYFGWHSSG